MDRRLLAVAALIAIIGIGLVGYNALKPGSPEAPEEPEVPEEPGEPQQPEPPPTPQEAVVSGIVLSEEGEPLPGVTVAVGSTQVETDAEGRFNVTVEPGSYVVQVSKPNYSQGIKTITVEAGDRVEAEFTLRLIETTGGEGKTIRVITRHGADIMLVAENLFLKSEFAKENNIVDLEWLPIADSLWVETIRRSGDVDVAWGGGPDLFDIILGEGLLAPLEGGGIEEVLDAIPDEIGGSETKRILDGKVYWVGAAISSFGFTINTELLDYYGLPEPTTWADLGSPVYAAYLPTTLVGTADATTSTSNTRIFQIILQIYGWEEGWNLLVRMGANARIFDQSGNVRDAVINREIAVGTTIDFYGYTAQWLNPEFCRYVFPADGTIVNADPIALLTTSQNRELAQGFIKWVISPEGQRVWLDGNINRMPINEAVFDTPEGQQRADLAEVYQKTKEALTIKFNSTEGASYYSSIRSFHRAVIVLPQIQLEKLWEDMNWALETGEITQEEFDELASRIGNPLEMEFTDPETGETQVFTKAYAQSINQRMATDVEYKQRMTDAWLAAALAHYEELSEELAGLTAG